jgi:peroxiredoxin Q/BCP
MPLAVGDTAPNFTVKDTNGNLVSLSNYSGKTVVLYFYPKDDTPGCTKEACSFRDSYSAYQGKDVVVLGVSMDDEASHQKFTEKYSLPFPLLADTEGARYLCSRW